MSQIWRTKAVCDWKSQSRQKCSADMMTRKQESGSFSLLSPTCDFLYRERRGLIATNSSQLNFRKQIVSSGAIMKEYLETNVVVEPS